MTEIPDDIMKAAADALLAGGYSVRIGSDGHKAIARAILSERERCDGVVEALTELAAHVKHNHFYTDREIAKAMVAKARAAISAIRRGDE